MLCLMLSSVCLRPTGAQGTWPLPLVCSGALEEGVGYISPYDKARHRLPGRGGWMRPPGGVTDEIGQFLYDQRAGLGPSISVGAVPLTTRRRPERAEAVIRPSGEGHCSRTARARGRLGDDMRPKAEPLSDRDARNIAKHRTPDPMTERTSYMLEVCHPLAG